MKSGLILSLICSLLLFSPSLSVLAATCRDYQGQKICILEIHRSAKYYWQYRVDLTVNGRRQPQTIYNCLEKTKQVKHKTVIAFTDDDPGILICSLFKFD